MKSMYEARLNEKDKTIESLQDRIQNYLYDADGELWLKKCKSIEDSQMKHWSDCAYSAPPHTPDKNDVVTMTNDTERVEAAAYPRPHDNKFTSHQDQGHNLYDTNAFSDKDVSSSTSHNDHNRDNATQIFDIILLHDSLCHEIDMRQFIGYSRRSGWKQVTYTTTAALKYVDKIHHANTTILHVGINDLKTFSVGATFARYRTLVDEVLKKSESVVLSLILPVGYVGLNKKIRELNDKIVSFYSYMNHVSDFLQL